MAEERALAPARAPDRSEQLSKEELQRRMDETRDSITNTVSEIKECVAYQVQTVKETLDWREQYRRRPLAWSLGAMGAGFLIGYKVAGVFKEDDRDDQYSTRYDYPKPPASEPRQSRLETDSRANGKDDEGPGLIERFKGTPAYDRLRSEVGTLGDRVVEELSKTAQVVVLPMLLGKLKQLIGVELSEERSAEGAIGSKHEEEERERYQPVYPRPS